MEGSPLQDLKDFAANHTGDLSMPLPSRHDQHEFLVREATVGATGLREALQNNGKTPEDYAQDFTAIAERPSSDNPAASN